MTFADPCLDADYVTFSSPTQTSPSDNAYDGDQVWTYTPYTATPVWCEITVECLDVVDDSDASVIDKVPCATPDEVSNELSRTFGQSDYESGLAPGTYTQKMKVSTGPGVEVEFEYTFTLLDPCKSPQMTVTPAVYAD